MTPGSASIGNGSFKYCQILALKLSGSLHWKGEEEQIPNHCDLRWNVISAIKYGKNNIMALRKRTFFQLRLGTGFWGFFFKIFI